MARTKITAYVTPGIAETLKRLAAIDDRSVSDVVEDAISRRLSDSGQDAEHAVLVARLDQIARRLGVIEVAQETHFELSAQGTRFAMSIAPEIPDQERAALNARGADRLRNLLSLVVAKLGAGRSTLRNVALEQETLRGTQAANLEAAE